MLATRSRFFALAIMLLALTPRPAWSQSATALLNGTVFDPAGAVVPNAEVTLTHVDTSNAMETATGAEGLYSFPQLQLGEYELKVSAPGFRDYVQSGITLSLGDKVRVDIKLELGTAQQIIEVHADASALNFENAEQKAGIAPQTLGELPLIVGGGVRSTATFLSLLPARFPPPEMCWTPTSTARRNMPGKSSSTAPVSSIRPGARAFGGRPISRSRPTWLVSCRCCKPTTSRNTAPRREP
jgi:hypothetical protein